ncbi:tryptophan aminotransferase-related protein 4-like [Andrographis paniculata]|uniref:tryptophan aminotransferase-related protein 4-like n=1 Tax=Andrographis paniculata TaxID=175694 RepID=UPI0021E94A53|nr:tryptophan aminotransferase-related protein 4-like [Andrographis paniculata]
MKPAWIGLGLFFCTLFLLLASLGLNLFFFINPYLSISATPNWSQGAAKEAEAVAAIACSGHGRAYVDGVLSSDQKTPICECNSCYSGPDCSQFSPHCPLEAQIGDPLYLEPFWEDHAAAAAVVISSWHRMSYDYPDGSYISEQLENRIRQLHTVSKNAIIDGKRIVFGLGSTQLLNAATYALAVKFNSSSPAPAPAPTKVVAASPFYPYYRRQTEFFQNGIFEFAGDVSNASADGDRVIEFVTSPNNPDGSLRGPVLQGKTIHDLAYYWPHYTAIPGPVDEDVMLFTMSKFTGHAGSRFGWAFVRDEDVYATMTNFIELAGMGVPREVQLRALKVIETILQGNDVAELFEHAYAKMSYRWRIVNEVISLSNRFSIQHLPPLYCTYFNRVRDSSPAYVWLKCEREEEVDCEKVLETENIIGRGGVEFNADSHYVRLNLLMRDDDFNIMISRLNQLVYDKKNSAKAKAALNDRIPMVPFTRAGLAAVR